jgi:lipoprotein-anchoring transpeptidase ErfK/SrfK
MDHKIIEARELIIQARQAMRGGDKLSARQLGERAALLTPESEDVWLILAASDPDPQEALAYARKALELNPQSSRAHRAVQWASAQVKQAAPALERTQPALLPNTVEATPLPQIHAYQTAVAMPALRVQKRNWLLPALLVGAGLALVGFLVLLAFTSPMLASLVSRIGAPAPTHEILWASSKIAKPDVAPVSMDVPAQPAQQSSPPLADAPQPDPALDVAPTATEEPAVEPTAVPTEIPTEESASAPDPAATEAPSGGMTMEIVEDTSTDLVAPEPAAPQYASGNGERWIDVDLTNQSVYAYEGDAVVNSFIVSTGTWLTPTVTGQYKIYVKIRSGNMHGPGYFLPDVPYIMYFYKGYGLHGTYWHNNFGTPMSHGCVNLRTDEAAWLFNWASVGTVVNVHY